jgi:hypothetical protein
VNPRFQLGLFGPPSSAQSIEATRRLLDPIQAKLIAAHVTLCREDEIPGLDFSGLSARLKNSAFRSFVMRFGAPEMFEGHGVLLPCVEGESEFHELRRIVLNASVVRHRLPHLTLAHPRNPRAAGNTVQNLHAISTGLEATFSSVQFIQQVGSKPWQLLTEYSLLPGAASDA